MRGRQCRQTECGTFPYNRRKLAAHNAAVCSDAGFRSRILYAARVTCRAAGRLASFVGRKQTRDEQDHHTGALEDTLHQA